MGKEHMMVEYANDEHRKPGCVKVKCVNVKYAKVRCVNGKCEKVKYVNVKCAKVRCVNGKCEKVKCVNAECEKVKYVKAEHMKPEHIKTQYIKTKYMKKKHINDGQIKYEYIKNTNVKAGKIFCVCLLFVMLLCGCAVRSPMKSEMQSESGTRTEGGKQSESGTRTEGGTQSESGTRTEGGTQSHNGTQDSGELVFAGNPLLDPEDAENRNMAGLLQQTASGALVRLEAEGTVGSGVIYEMNAERMVVVTAGHVLKGRREVKIVFSDGLELVCGEPAISEHADVGFLTVGMERVPEENAGHYCYASTDKETADGMVSGDGIIVTGSRDGAAGNAYEGELLDPWIYMEDFSQYMMWGKTYVKAGMSGGGVFDLKGRLIGILCGEDGENGIAVLPLSIIRTEYGQLMGIS